MTVQDTENFLSQSDQYTTDCESETSFDCWTDEDKIDVMSIWTNNNNVNDDVESLVDEIRLDYFI